jgi:hypothetical protein
MRAIAPLLTLSIAALAFAAPATAAADDNTVRADLNGDGQLDTVLVEPVADNGDEQRLVATINGIELDATMPMDPYFGVQPLRVVDINGDGWHEVVVTEFVGANTLDQTVWGLFGGLNPVLGPDLAPLRLWEGGGLSALSRYACESSDGGRQLVTVSAQADDVTFEHYQGERITYTVHNGVATEVARTEVDGPQDDPVFEADPDTCA